jgi:hypothetical protein
VCSAQQGKGLKNPKYRENNGAEAPEELNICAYFLTCLFLLHFGRLQGSYQPVSPQKVRDSSQSETQG